MAFLLALVVDGTLHLNDSKRVQKKWEADIPTLITQGEAYWPGVRSK